jgi:alkenylglycerophosphocholine/alkenylglycerophosphoethanolamine hydrolase
MKTRHPQRPTEDGEPDLAIDRSARVLSAELPIRAELLYIGGLGAILFLVGLALDWQFLRLISKPWPVVALARWVLNESRERKRPELRTTAYALIAGATGDVFLEIGPSSFVLGVAAFLVGHVFYIQALHRETVELHPLRALPGLAFVSVVVGVLAPELPRTLLVAFTVYALAIAGLVFRAAARADSPSVEQRWARLGLLGACVFAVSDAVLAINRFHTDVPGGRYLVIVTYWTAQALLAASLVRGAKPWAPKETPEALEPTETTSNLATGSSDETSSEPALEQGTPEPVHTEETPEA